MTHSFRVLYDRVGSFNISVPKRDKPPVTQLASPKLVPPNSKATRKWQRRHGSH